MSSKPRRKKRGQEYTLRGFKGFDMDFCCRGMQYESGKCFSAEGTIERCENGLHFCRKFLDTFSYYSPDESRYAIVYGGGEIDAGDASLITPYEGDSKVAAERLRVDQEIQVDNIASWLDNDHHDIVLDSELPQEETSGVCKRLTERGKSYNVEATVCVGMERYQYIDAIHGSAIAAGRCSVADAASSNTIAVTTQPCSIACANWYCRIAVSLNSCSIAQATEASSVVVAMEEHSRAILRCHHSIGITFDRLSQMDSSGSCNVLVCESNVVSTGKNTIIVFPISASGNATIRAAKDTFLVFFLNPMYTGEIVTMRIGDYGTVTDRTYTLDGLRAAIRGKKSCTDKIERFPLD